jgi:hypothetical protein
VYTSAIRLVPSLLIRFQMASHSIAQAVGCDCANASFPELAASSAFTLAAYGQAQHDLDD